MHTSMLEHLHASIGNLEKKGKTLKEIHTNKCIHEFMNLIKQKKVTTNRAVHEPCTGMQASFSSARILIIIETRNLHT